MKIEWQIESKDLEKVQEFVKLHHNNPFVQDRIKKNLEDTKTSPTQREFWHVMVSCLLTTQQRSGPKSAIAKLINTKPFPLRYEVILLLKDPETFIINTLSDFGGIRRTNRIADEVTTNLESLEKGLWDQLFDEIDMLIHLQNPQREREAAEFIEDHFKGFGPKQSRNLLQDLGLTRYEIPLDSRITKWLNDFGFPIKLSSKALADRNYYNFVSEGFQQLCSESGVYPCVMDAVIFSSFDKEGWT